MEQKLEELKKIDDSQAKEYFEFIKSSVEDKTYFKDALDWYLFRYVAPICDRTLLTFGAILSIVVMFFLYSMIESAFPLVEKKPIFIASSDQSLYFPSLIPLKVKKGELGYDPDIVTIDEALIKYLISTYVKKREEYDYSKAEVDVVNRQFNYVRNNSTADEYRNFQMMMSRDNPESPLLNFGVNVSKTVKIDSVKLSKDKPDDLMEKTRSFFAASIPSSAEIRFTTTLKTVDDSGESKENRQSYVVQINFNFSGVKKNSRNNDLNFIVNGYKLFKVK